MQATRGGMRCCGRCAFRAVRNRHSACLRSLDRDELAQTDSHLQTPLHVAVRLNFLDILEELLQLAPQLNDTQSALGETPALLAAALGHSECLQALLQGGLSDGLKRALITDLNGTSVLMAAVVRGDNDMALWLLRRFGKALAMQPNACRMLPLHVAAAKGNLEFIRIATKYDRQMINYRDQFGCGPCAYAVEGGCLAGVRYMVEKAGADPAALSTRGRSLLHSAALAGHHRVLVYLLTRLPPAFVFAKTLDGATCFHFAAYGGHVDVFRLLSRCCSRRRLRVVLAQRDSRGNTALHLAALNNHLQVAKLLIEIGGDLKTKTNTAGQTAESIALLKNNFDMAKLIQSGGKTKKNKKMKQFETGWMSGTMPSQTVKNSVMGTISPSSGYGSVSDTTRAFSSRASQTDPDSLLDRIQLLELDWQGEGLAAVEHIDRVLNEVEATSDSCSMHVL